MQARADGRLAVIEISGFNQDTAHALEQAVAELEAEMGETLAGYVLDLRGNPGGLLDQAVDVADLFVRHGRLVSTHGRHPDSHQYFTARPNDVGDDRPVVVLIDSGSASAAEIVAAAIQDNRRGVVVGSLSYGKGTVQTVLRLPNRGELTLTWARFHAPSGYALAGRGVTPDVCTSRQPDPALEQVLADLSAARSADNRAGDPLPKAGGLPDDTGPPATACPARPGGSAADLAVARRLLSDRTLYRSASTAAPAIAQAAQP
ncbi:MAG: S41 family peptidase [Rhodovibrio sp.]|nr:S41 family peptidase [Rhodovibrio sp.]